MIREVKRKEMKNKILACLLSATMVAGMLTGCGSASAGVSKASDTAQVSPAASAAASSAASSASASSADNSGSKPTELSFYIWDDEKAYITQVVDQYNSSQSKVKINLTVIPSEEYDDKLKVLLAADSDVDLVDIRGLSQVTTYASTGSLLDITDRIASSGLDTSRYGDMWKTANVDGKNYALPTRTTCWELYYNKDLFDKAGIDYPKQMTWEEYGDLAKKLQEKTGVNGGYWVPWIFQFAAVQQGVYVDCDDSENDKLAYSLQLLNRFYNVDKTHMSYADMTANNPEYLGEFENGKCAMLPNGEWCVQMLLADEASGAGKVNWQVAPMPVPDGVEPGTTWGQFQFAAVTSTCKHPDEAFDFLKYLCGEEGSVIYSKNGMIHAYSGDNAKAAYMKAAGKDCVSVFFDAKKIQEAPNTVGYDEILNAFNENAQLYLLGEKTIDETMTNFAKQKDEIKAKNAK